MQFHHSPERSTEVLRKALPLMSRQAAALDPVSFALWYAYASDERSALRAEVDQALARQGQLDGASTLALYQRHLAGLDGDAALRMGDGLQRVMGQMAAQTAAANDQTQQYGHALQRAAAALSADAQPDPSQPAAPALQPGDLVHELLAHTQQMQEHLSQLQRELAESQRKINQLRQEVNQARQESLVDTLTGLANRRAFDTHLASSLQAGGASLLLADLDHFKRINDTYGHGFGDQVLRAVAQLLGRAAPAGALVARIGGEEFAVLLPALPAPQAAQVAEQMRQAVSANRIRRKGQADSSERVTLSLGVACSLAGERSAALLERADRALYAAKAGGRDRVMVAGQAAAGQAPGTTAAPQAPHQALQQAPLSA